MSFARPGRVPGWRRRPPRRSASAAPDCSGRPRGAAEPRSRWSVARPPAGRSAAPPGARPVPVAGPPAGRRGLAPAPGSWPPPGPSPPDRLRGSPTTISIGSYSRDHGRDPVQLAVPGRDGRDREGQRGGRGHRPPPRSARRRGPEPAGRPHARCRPPTWRPPAWRSLARRPPFPESVGLRLRHAGRGCRKPTVSGRAPSTGSGTQRIHEDCRTCPIACSTAVSAATGLRPVAAAALGDVVLAAAATAESLRPGPDQIAGLQPSVPRAGGRHDDDARLLRECRRPPRPRRPGPRPGPGPPAPERAGRCRRSRPPLRSRQPGATGTPRPTSRARGRRSGRPASSGWPTSARRSPAPPP